MSTVRTMRTYGDVCGVAHALDLVGERWALLVVRELLFGARRFTDLRGGLPGTSSNVLSQRLRELEQIGVVRRYKLAPPAASWVYELTDWGRELEPIVHALGCWAMRSSFLDDEGTLSVASAVLMVRTFFEPPADAPFTANYELRFGDDCFTARIDGDQVTVVRGEATEPDTTIETDPKTFVALLGRKVGIGEAVDAGHARVAGDTDAFERLIATIAIPEQVPLPTA